MLENLFIKGWMIGFSIALPVGPIAILCIQHCLLRGMAYGLAAGLGAALADTLYGALAAFGVSLLSQLLANHQLWLQLVGAIFLCYLGISTINSTPLSESKIPVSHGLGRVCLTTFLLTLINPLTFLGFTGIYAALGIGLEEEGLMSKFILISGVFVGSALWWLVLSCGTSQLAKKIHYKPTQLLHKISGSIILAFGFITSLAIFQQVLM